MTDQRNKLTQVCIGKTDFIEVICVSICDRKAATSLKSAPQMSDTHKTKHVSLQLPAQFTILTDSLRPRNSLLFLKL